VDLGREDALVARIDSVGWSLTHDCPFKFYRPPGFQGMPDPAPGDFNGFRTLLGLDDSSAALVLAFMLNCLRPTGPYMWLAIEGEQGSGKSVASTMIRQTIDPHASPKLRLADNERDLMLHAQENFLITYDNASGMKNDISDALCSLATGGGIAARKYYTDDQLRVFTFARPFIINGIADFAHRPDLLDRAIPLRLRAMPDGERRPEKVMLEEYECIRPRLLGFLFDCVSCALRNEASVSAPTDIRMADSAAWLVAAEPATGLRPGLVLEAIKSAQLEAGFDRVMNDRIIIDIMRLTEKFGIVGYVGALFDALSPFWNQQDKSTPKSPALLSRHLARLAPALRKQGLLVDLTERSNKGKRVKIWRADQDPTQLLELAEVDRGHAARETVNRRVFDIQIVPGAAQATMDAAKSASSAAAEKSPETQATKRLPTGPKRPLRKKANRSSAKRKHPKTSGRGGK
ncbi:MAG: hypothetical protein ABL996_20235, partial [Micropepsaceae bacterium]